MLKKSVVLISILACFFAVAAEAADYVIRVGHSQASEHHYHYGLQYFVDKVAEKTNDRVQIHIFPASQLGGQREEFQGCMVGTHDMVLTATNVMSNFEPTIGVFDMPFIFRSREHAYAVADGEIGNEMSAIFEEMGIKVLAYWENGFRYITNSIRPIRVPEDLKGLKIRVPDSPAYLDTFLTLGAAATPMAMGEVFSALQLKTIDGQENPAAHVINNAFYEVQKYISLTGHFYTHELLVMSKALYDSFPADIQKALIEAAVEARDYQRELSRKYDQECIEKIKELGMEVMEVDVAKFQEATKPVYEKYPQYKELVERIRAVNP